MESDSQMIVLEHAEPHLVYRVNDGKIECALWTLADGRKCLALFSSLEAANLFTGAAGLSADWRATKAFPPDLLTVLRHCHEGNVPLAVLDPDQEKGKRLFNIAEVLRAVDASAATPSALD